MKAKDISGQAPGGKRTRLAEVLPLDTPFVVQIFPIYACVFKCCYCIFSIDPAKRGFISDKVIMDFDLYKKCVDDMAKFPNKIKVLRFVGIGEPLLHKSIIEMVAYAAEKKVANTIEILTNAALLDHKMSDAMISSGLNRLVVSLQGTTGEKYKKTCGVSINFKEFVNNLKYFFDHKGGVDVYFKIVDSALNGKEDEENFYNIFGDICDSIAIEHTVPIHAGIDYSDVVRDSKNPVTQFGLPVKDLKVCPQPFFTMQINPDGKVVPCFSFEYPGIMGDCNSQSVVDIWNSDKFQTFRRRVLCGPENTCETCVNCNIMKYRLFPEDDLSNDVERLKKLYGA